MLTEITEEMEAAAIEEYGFVPNPYWMPHMATGPPHILKDIQAAFKNTGQCASWKKNGEKCTRASLEVSDYCLAHDTYGAYDEPK